MTSYKAKLTKSQRRVFQTLTQAGYENLTEGENFVIIGQLMIPDNVNELIEPEIEFTILTGINALEMKDEFKKRLKIEELKP